MRRTLAIFIAIITLFLLTGCMSSEQQEEAKNLEKNATKYMEAYLSENHPTFEIVIAKQIIDGDFINGYNVTALTKVIVKEDKKEYTFYYNKDTNDVLSNVCYESIITEFNTKLNQNKTLKRAFKNETKIDCFGYKVTVDGHKTLNDIIEFAKTNTNVYSFDAAYYFNNESNFNPKDLGVVDLYDAFPNMNLSLYNTPDGKPKSKELWFEYIDIIECQNDVDETTKERVINISHKHRTLQKVDDVMYSFDNRYIDFTVNKSNDYYTEIVDNNGKPYKPMYRGYEYEVVTYDATQTNPNTNFTTSGGIKVQVTDDKSNVAIIYVIAKDYKDAGLYLHKKEELKKISKEVGEYDILEITEANEMDIISFMQESR